MPADRHLEARLGLLDATALVAGSMIGSGIFIVSADIARRLPAAGWLLAVWAATGLLTVAAAASYGRLAAAMPRAGGQYAYLVELWGPVWGFLFGWTLVLVIQTGTIAAVAVAFATFAGILWPALSPAASLVALGPLVVTPVQACAVAVVLGLTALNARGLEAGRTVQNVFTVAKVGALAAVVALGLALGDPAARVANLARPFATGLGAGATLMQFGAAMVGSLFAADAWANVTFAASEVRDPRRTVPRALVLGTALVCLLYLATNVAYLNVLPLAGVPDGSDAFARGIAHASGDRVGAAVMDRLAGSARGGVLIAVAVMVSTFGCANGLVLAGARVAWAMARDGRFFAVAGRLNARNVPGAALWLQGAWASVLALSGRYGDLLDYVIVAELLFYLLTVGGLFRLAARTGERPRDGGYPWLPAGYLAAVGALVVDLLVTKPAYTWGSVAVVASGVPFWLLRRPAPAVDAPAGRRVG
ncbi:MAG TPA: amino acid permease [Candidatus Binatia bacterium]|nr:amino acid permease [Candidatus Binatia bacterium]